MYNQGCGLIVMNISQCFLLHDNVSAASVSRPFINLQRLVELYLIGLVCLLGIFGNVLTFVVFRRDKERREVTLLLQVLALADGLYLIVAILRYPLKYLIPVYRHYIEMQPVIFPMLKTCQTITIWTIVLVTLDRYIYICKPFFALQMFKRDTRRRTAVCVFIAGILFNLPRYFDSCIVEWFNPCNNTTLIRSVTSPQFNHPLYYDIYKQGACIILLYIVPLFALSYMNARLVQAIYNSKRRHRHSSTTSDYSENNATRVLIIIVLLFIVCETPELFLRMAAVVERKIKTAIFTREFSKALIRLNLVSQLFMVINSSLNFLVYFVFGQRFRTFMKEIFRYRFLRSVTHVINEDYPLQTYAPSMRIDRLPKTQITHVKSKQPLNKEVHIG